MKRCNTLVAFMKIFTARNSSYGKAMFSEACVSHSVHRGGGGVGGGVGYLWSMSFPVVGIGYPVGRVYPVGGGIPLDTLLPETTKAGGRHPTGMLSCSRSNYTMRTNLTLMDTLLIEATTL